MQQEKGEKNPKPLEIKVETYFHSKLITLMTMDFIVLICNLLLKECLPINGHLSAIFFFAK